jgi:hypothetical protein
VLVCSAAEDQWADPRAELAALRGADPVYRLLGATDTGVAGIPAHPPLNTVIGQRLSYHIRPGKHAVGEADWRVFVEFCQRWIGGGPQREKHP